MQHIEWDSYLSPATGSVAEHRARSADTFAGQRRNIKKLCHILNPHAVLCMGAGYLNDIPVEDFIAADADIYFVEWIKNVTDQAFRHDLVRQVERKFACLACKCSGNPRKYCKNYQKHDTNAFSFLLRKEGSEHCENFKLAEEGVTPQCANYVPGEFPCFLDCDVTRGTAENFSRNVPGILSRAQNPRQAFRHAIQKSEHPAGQKPIPLADHSMDFITSSMVASQFDFEPYTYFVRSLLRRFGQEAINLDMEKLDTLERTLRDNLFIAQVEAHCREVLRLLKLGARAYFSMEILHRARSSDPWFQAEVTSKTMGIIGGYFYFDVETLPEIMTAERIVLADGSESIVQAHLLLAK